MDSGVHHYFVTHQNAALHVLMQGLSLLANGGALTVIALLCVVALFLRPPFRPDAFSMLAAIGGGEFCWSASNSCSIVRAPRSSSRAWATRSLLDIRSSPSLFTA